MKILALIPARSGSKRLPGKNIRKLNGKPLIEWTIQIAKLVNEITEIIVSTDDVEIAQIARDAGATVPWLRPQSLSNDKASSAEVALHALNYYEGEFGKVDGLMLLQPTSPFRSRETITHGIREFSRRNKQRVISVSPANVSPAKFDISSCFKIIDNQLQPITQLDSASLLESQFNIYVPNGCFYLISPDDLRRDRSFYGGDIVPLIIDKAWEAIDIDTEADWKLAELYLDLIPLG